MGKQGTKIAGLDVKDLLKDLNKAYADEWLAYYSYWYMANLCNPMLDKIKNSLIREPMTFRQV